MSTGDSDYSHGPGWEGASGYKRQSTNTNLFAGFARFDVRTVCLFQTCLAAMARHVDKSTLDTIEAELTEQRRVREQFMRLLGWKPESVQFLKRGRWGVCLVKVQAGLGCPVEFVFAEGVLVGIPPKKRWGL